jgi:hypothetical protein
MHQIEIGNTMSSDMLVFNGINGASGEYLLPPMTPKQVAGIVQGERQDPEHLKELRWWYQRVKQVTLGPKEGVDPKNLAEAGWGVIFAHDGAPGIREALKELLDIKFGAQADEFELSGMWTANNDSRSYIILGDPAVRLVVSASSSPLEERSSLEIVTPKSPPLEAELEAAQPIPRLSPMASATRVSVHEHTPTVNAGSLSPNTSRGCQR